MLGSPGGNRGEWGASHLLKFTFSSLSCSLDSGNFGEMRMCPYERDRLRAFIFRANELSCLGSKRWGNEWEQDEVIHDWRHNRGLFFVLRLTP